MNDHVVVVGRRQIRNACPVRSPIRGREGVMLRPQEECVVGVRVLDNHIDHSHFGERPVQCDPSLTEVPRAEDIGPEIAVLVRVEGRVGRASCSRGRRKSTHIGAVGDSGHVARHLDPISAAVATHLNVSVVEADPEDRRVEWRLVQRRRFSEGSSAVVSGQRDIAPPHAHHFELVAIDLTTQVLGGRPRTPSVVGRE